MLIQVVKPVSGIPVTLAVFMDTKIRVEEGEGEILLHCGWSGSSFPPELHPSWASGALWAHRPVVRVTEPAHHRGHRSHSVPL